MFSAVGTSSGMSSVMPRVRAMPAGLKLRPIGDVLAGQRANDLSQAVRETGDGEDPRA
jgi:hypothetical protein